MRNDRIGPAMKQTSTHPILEKIADTEHLPSLPAVAVRVLDLIRQEEVSVTEIAKTIAQDPVLSAKILKVVNSPLFGMPNNISSLPQAMVVLGLRTLKVMVLSFSMVGELAKLRDESFDHELFWRRSVTTAVSSSLLAEKCDPRIQDEAFVAGLLADLGILAASQCARSDYQLVLKRYHEGTCPLQEVEGRELGVTHAEMSAVLLEGWKLPDRLIRAARHHHDDDIPPMDEDGYCLTRLVWTAALISDLFCQDIPSTDLDPLKETIVQALSAAVPEGGVRISPGDIDAILEQVDQYVCQTAQDISLQIGQTKSYEELRVMAMAQLAQLSVSAEMDLAAASQKAVEVQQQIAVLSKEKRVLTQTANTDDLTQIANRKAFNDEIERAGKYARDTGHSVGLLMCDLDHFKQINDTYGHLFGDEVLKAVGEVLRGIEDRAHFVARYGGEEFAVICFRSSMDDLADIAEVVRQEIEKIDLKYGTQIVRITTSVGAAQANDAMGEITAEALIKRADKCLFEAKRAGRNRVIIAR